MDSPLFNKDSNGKFLFIRHGETIFNSYTTPENKFEIKTKAEYINSPLSDKGKEQAKSLNETVNKFYIEDIYVSPLTRALQTAYLIFENHPQRENIVIKVHPWVTETVSGVHDFSYDISERKAEFNMNSKVKFDWSIFDEFFPTKKEQDLNFLEYIDYFDEQQRHDTFDPIYKAYDEGNKEELIKNVAYLSRYAVDHGFLRCETLKAMLQRGNRFKLYLKDKYKDTFNDLNKKVIVVTHSSLCKILTSKKAYAMKEIPDFPDDSYMMNNCEIISMNI